MIGQHPIGAAALGSQAGVASVPVASSNTAILGLGFFGINPIGAAALAAESESIHASAVVTGVSSGAAVGDEIVTGTASASPLGVTSLAVIGTENVTADDPIQITVSGVLSPARAGTVTVTGNSTTVVSGVSSLSVVGDEIVQVPSPDIVACPAGVSSAAVLGNIATPTTSGQSASSGTTRPRRKGRAGAKWSGTGLGPGWVPYQGDEPIDLSPLLRRDALVKASGVSAGIWAGWVTLKANRSATVKVSGVSWQATAYRAIPYGAKNPSEEELIAVAERFGLL